MSAQAQLPSIAVAQARELFFGQGADPAPWIAPHISRSWQRRRRSTTMPSTPSRWRSPC